MTHCSDEIQLHVFSHWVFQPEAHGYLNVNNKMTGFFPFFLNIFMSSCRKHDKTVFGEMVVPIFTNCTVKFWLAIAHTDTDYF